MNQNNFKETKHDVSFEKQLERIVYQNKLKNCELCHGALEFMGGGRYICSQCSHEQFDDFGKIKAFLEEAGPTPAVVISKATGVDLKNVKAFLDHGRIEVAEGSAVFLQCEICGADIKFGRICPTCARNETAKMKGYLVEEVGEVPKRKTKAGKIHFINQD